MNELNEKNIQIKVLSKIIKLYRLALIENCYLNL